MTTPRYITQEGKSCDEESNLTKVFLESTSMWVGSIISFFQIPLPPSNKHNSAHFLALKVCRILWGRGGRGGDVSRRRGQRRLIVGYPPINPRNLSLPDLPDHC